MYNKNYEIWLNSPYVDDELKKELKEIEKIESEIEDRFYKDLEFGTGGMRGKIGAGTNRMNLVTVAKATQGIANYLIEKYKSEEISAAIAYDSRNMSKEFAEKAACVFAANNIKVYLFDSLRPTPVLSYAVRYYNCKARYVKNRGYYLDLVLLYDTIKKKDYQYPSTPNLSLMFALNYQLDRIMDEGMENRFERHLAMAEYTRTWAKKNFALFADEKHASVTLTTVDNIRKISVKNLNEELGKRGFAISNGYGSLKEKTFRIAHMGDLTLDEVKDLLFNIDDILSLA
jgi:hypothetical protein